MTTASRFARVKNRRGYALILVLMVAAIGGLAVAGMAHTVRYETLMMKSARDAAQRRHAESRNAAIPNSEKAKAKAAVAPPN